jgi:ribosomal protein L6P/L9E
MQWNVYNQTFIKFSEKKNELGIYYSRNYAKNRIKISRKMNQLHFSTYLDLEYFPADNVANQISGYTDFFQKKMGIGSGYKIQFHQPTWYVENELNYFYKSFNTSHLNDEKAKWLTNRI